MKELSIVEKARAYDEAKYIMNEYLESGNAGVIAENTIKKAFPELEESEDEKIRKALIEYFNEQCDMSDWNGVYGYQVIAWLEKQGEQKSVDDLTPQEAMDIAVAKCFEEGEQKTAAWSEEDEKIYQSIMDDTVQENQLNSNQTNWLRDIKYRYFPQPKQEWSAEDERNLQGIIDEIEANKNHAPDYDVATYDRFLSWLKSLRPQNRWKPSDEQMEALESATENCAYSEYQDCLRELIEQLKKLREE